ncbi:MAG: FecR family protein [Flavicella sp.]
MESIEKDDTFLGRWLNNSLSEEERQKFEQTSEFKEYQKIIAQTENLEVPNFDQKGVFEKITQEIEKSKKVRLLFPQWIAGVAVSISLILGIYFWNNKEVTFTTSAGEILALKLPDGSKVQLNAASELSFDDGKWEEGIRSLTLHGEAYFEVEKGSNFTVETDRGSVSVLGTQFNVKQYQSYFEVNCFKGRVKVEDAFNDLFLLPGKGYQKFKTEPAKLLDFETESPSWLKGESSFSNVPLSIVVLEIERQYAIQIHLEVSNMDQPFSGSFTNTNLEVALQTIAIPMGLQYNFEKDGSCILSD